MKQATQLQFCLNSSWVCDLPAKLCVIQSETVTQLISSFVGVTLSIFQVALNTEIENLGKSYGGNNLDESLTYVEAKNNHASKASWVSKEEFQVYVGAGISLTPLQIKVWSLLLSPLI